MIKESMCEALLDNTAEIVISFGESGDIIFANQSALEKLEYTEEDLKKRNMCDFFQQEFQQPEGEPPVSFDVSVLSNKDETVMYRKKTSCFPVSIRVLEASPGEYYLLAEDITLQKEMDKRIWQIKQEEEENLKMRDEFTANVTHELRTPVNGIRGHVTNLLAQPVTPEQKKTLEIILFCCENMSSIINNILDFSKLEANKFTLEDRKFDFYEMMDKVLATHTAELNKKELALNVYINKNVPQFVIGDSLRIGQVLNNLLSNAVKFTKVGHISVDVNKTWQSQDVIELFFMVRDTGIGISKEDQDKLFNSFQQVDASVTRNFGGTGLGLYITKQLVEMMDGGIWLESEKGKGSCFSFSVKVRTEQSGEEESVLQTTWDSWNNMMEEDGTGDELYVFGSDENKKELTRRMEKLVLAVELGSWEKAEMLTDTIKALSPEDDAELKRLILRMEMAVRKENYDRSMTAYDALKTVLYEKLGL